MCFLSCQISFRCFFLPFLLIDDNSNQSSIADASPIKQENSSNSSPAPEQNLSTQADSTEVKSDETQAEAKEQPGSEGEPKKTSSEPNKKCYPLVHHLFA